MQRLHCYESLNDAICEPREEEKNILFGWSECVRLRMVVNSRKYFCTDFRWTLVWYYRDVYNRILSYGQIFEIFFKRTRKYLWFVCVLNVMRCDSLSAQTHKKTRNTKNCRKSLKKGWFRQQARVIQRTHDNLSKQDNKLNNIEANYEKKICKIESRAVYGVWENGSGCHVAFSPRRRCMQRTGGVIIVFLLSFFFLISLNTKTLCTIIWSHYNRQPTIPTMDGNHTNESELLCGNDSKGHFIIWKLFPVHV